MPLIKSITGSFRWVYININWVTYSEINYRNPLYIFKALFPAMILLLFQARYILSIMQKEEPHFLMLRGQLNLDCNNVGVEDHIENVDCSNDLFAQTEVA